MFFKKRSVDIIPVISALMLVFVVMAFMIWPYSAEAELNLNAPQIQDKTLTPGALNPSVSLTTDMKVLCVAGYSKTVRNVPESLKNKVYVSYGITQRDRGEYEIDHLCSLELGCSNSQLNLWPQSYKTQPWNAFKKDHLENRLHALACAGTITFADAQREISEDWIAAYRKYIGED